MSGVPAKKRCNLDMLATAACDEQDYEWQAYLLRQRCAVLQQQADDMRKNNDELQERLDAALWLIEYANEAVRDHKLADRKYREAAAVVQHSTQELLKK